MRGVILINPEECIDCKTCEEVCASIHSESCIVVETKGELSVPVLCHHCEAPICAMVCGTNAIKKTGIGGLVIVDEDLCVGCRSCIIACPYGVLRLRKDGKTIIKCDLCRERLNRGEEPGCVEACSVEALKFKSLEGLTDSK